MTVNFALFQISIPNNVTLRCTAWNHKEGYIACGGDGGLLKVIKLENSGTNGNENLPLTSKLSVNQTLDGHNGTVKVIRWNENFQKLATSDQHGYIIVWTFYKGSWCEEMINNRNKSVVTDLQWSNDGNQICIAYEDGVVIVGSADGNRIWSKETKLSLVAVQVKCTICLFANDYYCPKPVKFETFSELINCTVTHLKSKIAILCTPTPEVHQLLTIQWHKPQFTGTLANDCAPSLAIVYQQGFLQIMRHENDPDPVILTFSIKITSAKWNPSGTLLLIAGQNLTLPEGEQNIIYFINAFGEHLRSLKVPGKWLTECSWEGTGLRIGLAVDSYIYFATIRPDYQVSIMRLDLILKKPHTFATPYILKMFQIHFKYVHQLCFVKCYKQHCVIIHNSDDNPGQYLVQLCNGIGTPVNFMNIKMDILFVVINSTDVIFANKESFCLWSYSSAGETSANIPVMFNGTKENICQLHSTSGDEVQPVF
ncbi:unnamed protein product [Soboliphyme baturini]|uniref:WD_REPEATS_REGION domain-containing protein n=1 Tax=Soboliphyme baturini TaxID=241478 RepID=A0A183IXH3_9BILA|nr:unnamed protein product [Soboliphyme baturini]